MKDYLLVKEVLCKFNVNNVIKASQIYKKYLINVISESSYYKILERMYKKNEISKLGKGLYYFAKKDEFGNIPISEKQIISIFTINNKGTIVGYMMYNKLHLTTQIPRVIEVYSSNSNNYTKNIRNVNIKKVNLDFTEDVVNIVNALEVLEKFDTIQDLNYKEFYEYTKQISKTYNETLLEKVINAISYKKRTLAFYKEILDYYNVDNNITNYLSSLSKYKIPKMEEIYEFSQESVCF